MRALRLLCVVAGLVCGVWAQGGIRFDSIALGPKGPIPNPTITVCGTGATGMPCSPPVNTYTSSSLATSCPSGSQVTLTQQTSCQATGDSSGNFGFWVPAGAFQYCITGPNIVGKCWVNTPVSGLFTGNPWADITSPTYGAACDDTTNDTAALNAAILATCGPSAIGGTVFVPPSANGCKINGADIVIPTDGATPQAHMKTCRITGATAGGLADFYNRSCNGASTLDMSGAVTNAHLVSLGLGDLEFDHICIKDTNTDGKPFFLTTLTNFKFHDNSIFGNCADTTKQDVWVAGGLNTTVDNTVNSEFQGYGGYFMNNTADCIGRLVLGQNQFNGFGITNNKVFGNSGNSTQYVIELNPGAAGLTDGNWIIGNLLEVTNYLGGVHIIQNGTYHTLIHNTCFDALAGVSNCVKEEQGSGNTGSLNLDSNPDLGGSHPSKSFMSTNSAMITNGLVQTALGSSTAPAVGPAGYTGSNAPGWRWTGFAGTFVGNGTDQMSLDFNGNGQFVVRGDVGSIGFSPASDPTAVPDTNISRRGAGEFGWTGITFSSLGTPVNGTFAFCSDCTIANPCAGGGSGALAKRLNGVWVCN